MLPYRLLAIASLPVCLAAGAYAQDPLQVARKYREEHGAAILREFAELLAIPNVASDEDNIRRNAEHIREQLVRRGVRAELWQLDGAPPIIFGELESPGAERTIGLYVHYDGQPVDPSQWAEPPWSPTLFSAAIEDGGEPRPWPEPGEDIDPEWRLYARSAGDDKAPIGALFAALDALKASNIPLSSNIKFFFEGEEEAGSPHLERYIAAHRAKLEVDLWLICDGPVHQSRRPQLVFGVRGFTGLEMTVYGADSYLHSGHYGNWAPNPALRLAQLLASMKDDDGRVLIDQFYDSVEPIGDAERQAIAALPDFDAELRRELGLAASEMKNAPLAERLLLPSLNLRGLVSATVGASARNVIPTQATASLDIRLVKGNDPEEMLDLVEAHIRSQGYHIVSDDPDAETRLAHAKIAKVRRQTGYRAARTALDLPVVQPVIRAAERAAGERTSEDGLILMPSLGGSLPLYLFSDHLAKPVVIVPMANHDNNQHAPNENLRLANLWYGIDLLAAILTME